MDSERLEVAEAHRLAQIRVRAQALRDALVFWQTIHPDRFDETWTQALDSVRDVIQAGYDRSADLATAHHQMHRRLAGLDDLGDVPRPVRMQTEQMLTSLRVTGPVAWRQAIAAGKTPQAAYEVALVRTQGAAGRLVLQGGRSRGHQLVAFDPASTKYLRTTDGDPCAFCAMLAGRGAVYVEDSFESSNASFNFGGNFKVHDHCGCALVPGFQADPDHLDRNRQFRDFYEQHATGGPSERLRNFRRAYDAQRPGA